MLRYSFELASSGKRHLVQSGVVDPVIRVNPSMIARSRRHFPLRIKADVRQAVPKESRLAHIGQCANARLLEFNCLALRRCFGRIRYASAIESSPPAAVGRPGAA